MMTKKSLLVLYGTETGTAQDVAENIRREAILQNISVQVSDWADYDIELLTPDLVVVFVIATAGQGEFPIDVLPSWRKLLRKTIPPNFFEGIFYAVFGLGDSSYQKFNFAAKKLFRRFGQLGATRLLDVGLGDEQHELGIDGALMLFKQSLWKSVHDMKLFKDSCPDFDPAVVLPSKFVLETSNDADVKFDLPDDYYPLVVKENIRVTAEDHFQDTRFITLRAPDEVSSHFSYRPGDVLSVYPMNMPETVLLAIDALHIPPELLDEPILLNPRDESVKVPPEWLVGRPTTLRICLERYFDLQAIPKRMFFETLGNLSCDEMEKEKLLELSSPQALDDYLDYCVRCRRTVAEALRDFPATSRSLAKEYYFEVFRPIRPRAFSIASSMEAHRDLQILVAKVEYKSRMSEMRKGLCSTFLARLKAGDKVYGKIRSGTFRFPGPDSPVMCVGPGTGVAPFRSLLSARVSFANIGASRSALFFGCRGAKKDFYFEDEWQRTESEGVKVVTAFSRDGAEKVYVQDKIRDEFEMVWEILTEGGFCFVAGSSGDMPRGVIAALNDVAKTKGWNRPEQFSDYLEKSGRLQFETWA